MILGMVIKQYAAHPLTNAAVLRVCCPFTMRLVSIDNLLTQCTSVTKTPSKFGNADRAST